MYEMVVGRRPFTIPSQHWLAPLKVHSSTDQLHSSNTESMVMSFYSDYCLPYLQRPDRGGVDSENNYDAEPITSTCWDFLLSHLLIAPELARIDTISDAAVSLFINSSLL